MMRIAIGSGLIVLAVVAATSATACSPSDDQQAGPPDAPAAVAPQPSAVAPPLAPGEGNAAAEPAAPAAAPAQTAAPPASPAPPPPAPAAPVFLDVRTEAEYQAGHVPGAILLPVEQLEQRWQELERYRDQPLVIYCRSGRRSAVALRLLTERLTSLEDGGGMTALVAARGLTVSKE
jgi:rhodanese-related sulfurtransferase